jgi:hypothetical protein
MKQQETLKVAVFGEKLSRKENIVNYIETKQDELKNLMKDNPKIKINPGLNIEFYNIDEEYFLDTNIFEKIDLAISVCNSQIVQLSHYIKWRYDIKHLIPESLKWVLIDYPCVDYISSAREYKEMINIFLPKDIYFYINYLDKQSYINSLNELIRLLKFEIKKTPKSLIDKTK